MYDRILVATDASDTAQRATQHALEVARQYGAELHAVYVIETRTGYDNAIVDPDTVRRNFREEGKDTLAEIESQADPEMSVITSVREGVPHEELLSYVQEEGIDLVVVGARGRSAFKTVLLGSTAEALLQADVVPILVINSEVT